MCVGYSGGVFEKERGRETNLSIEERTTHPDAFCSETKSFEDVGSTLDTTVLHREKEQRVRKCCFERKRERRTDDEDLRRSQDLGMESSNFLQNIDRWSRVLQLTT